MKEFMHKECQKILDLEDEIYSTLLRAKTLAELQSKILFNVAANAAMMGNFLIEKDSTEFDVKEILRVHEKAFRRPNLNYCEDEPEVIEDLGYAINSFTEDYHYFLGENNLLNYEGICEIEVEAHTDSNSYYATNSVEIDEQRLIITGAGFILNEREVAEKNTMRYIVYQILDEYFKKIFGALPLAVYNNSLHSRLCNMGSPRGLKPVTEISDIPFKLCESKTNEDIRIIASDIVYYLTRRMQEYLDKKHT